MPNLREAIYDASMGRGVGSIDYSIEETPHYLNYFQESLGQQHRPSVDTIQRVISHLRGEFSESTNTFLVEERAFQMVALYATKLLAEKADGKSHCSEEEMRLANLVVDKKDMAEIEKSFETDMTRAAQQLKTLDDIFEFTRWRQKSFVNSPAMSMASALELAVTGRHLHRIGDAQPALSNQTAPANLQM